MARVRVHNLVVSLDGYAAGPDQSLDDPFGVGGQVLTAWFWDTRFGRAMIGQDGGSTGVDDGWLERGVDGIGATVMGRNMFGPVRGEWPDYSWRGWWGEEPPFRCPVFVLTHAERPSLEMGGGTTFHFLATTPQEALERALAVAGGKDVRIGGGPTVVREFLKAGLVDELHVAIVPILLGRGIRLWDDLRGLESGYAVKADTAESGVIHLTFRR